MSMRIVLAGGGTGGHLYPLVQVAKKIKEKRPEAELLFLGPTGQMEEEIIGGDGIPMKRILAGKFYRYFTPRYILDIFKCPIGFFQSLWQLLLFMPDVVFAKGGYGSVPVVLAARIYRIPVLIHESDANPGLANRIIGSLAQKIAVTFERAKIHFPPSKTVLTGNPVNPGVLGGSAEEGRRLLGTVADRPVILIIGGSQGAQAINYRILTSLPKLLAKYEIVHQTGNANYDVALLEAGRAGFKVGHCQYHPYAFLKDEFKHFLALADLVISRAGSTAIAEIAANHKPAILVPITESANNHQRINAFEVSRRGGAQVLEENNFKENILLHKLEELFGNEKLRHGLAENIGRFYHPEAAEKIAAEVLALAS